MFYTIRIAKKGGRVLCHNCGTRVMPGRVYIRIDRVNYCVLCEGPGKHAWEALK